MKFEYAKELMLKQCDDLMKTTESITGGLSIDAKWWIWQLRWAIRFIKRYFAKNKR